MKIRILGTHSNFIQIEVSKAGRASARLQYRPIVHHLQPLRLQLRTVMTSNPSAYFIEQLSEYSACEISDALIKLGSPHGGHIPDIHLVSPPGLSRRICGPAYTVQMVFTSDTNAPKLSSHFVDTAPAGAVIVIDSPSSSVTLTFWNKVLQLTGHPSQLRRTRSGVGSCLPVRRLAKRLEW